MMRMLTLALVLIPAAALTVKDSEEKPKHKAAKLKEKAPEGPTLRDQWCENGRLLPSVMLLGAQKAGSTSLYRDLIRRFELTPAAVIQKEADWMAKEVSFFSDEKRFKRGRHFYLKHFPLCAQAGKWQRAMDASVALDHGEFYVTRLADFYGEKAKELKFIIIVRDPIKRMESEFHHGEIMVGNENAEGGITQKVQKEAKFEKFVLKQLDKDGDAMKWRSGNRTEDPPKYFKGSSYAFLIKPWLKRFDASQFTVITLKQYQTRTNATLKFLGSRLGMGMKDTSEMFEHVFANENKNKHDPMKREVLLKLEKYFEPLDEEWKAIVEEGHMSLEDEVEIKLTKHAPAKFMWTHESSSPKTGRKFDQEWALGPGKIYGNGISFIQTGEKFEPQAKAHVFVVNTADKLDKCHCMSAQMQESAIPYSVSRLTGSTPATMMTDCKAVPKLKELARRMGTRSFAGMESALFCSNYMAWKQALANHTDKDYIIIMEDDVMLQKKDTFWKKVDWFLDEGNKDCKDWDHVNVDPYEGAYKHIGMCPKFKISNPTQSGGAHFQIIRREKLQELVDYSEKHGAGLVDRFSDWMPKTIRKFSWKAGLVQQFNTKGRLFWMRPAKPGYCTEDVYKHQVSLLQDGKAESPDLAFMRASGKKLSFGCEGNSL